MGLMAGQTVWMVTMYNRAEMSIVGVYDYEPLLFEARVLAVRECGEERVKEITETLSGELDVVAWPVESREQRA